MESRTDTRSQILSLARSLILDRGYNAFSYQHISKELGIKNAAIHYHFPTKESLGMAVIAQTRANFIKRTAQWRSQQLNNMELLVAFQSLYVDNLDDGRKVCLFGTLATDFFAIPPKMQQEMRLLAGEILVWLTRVLEEGRKNLDFKFEGSAHDKATTVATGMAGALQIGRVFDESYFYAVANQILKDLTTNRE